MVLIEDAVKHTPGAECCRSACELRLGVEPGKDGWIGVGHVVVGVDARVGDSRERFGVAGITEVEDVGDV